MELEIYEGNRLISVNLNKTSLENVKLEILDMLGWSEEEWTEKKNHILMKLVGCDDKTEQLLNLL